MEPFVKIFKRITKWGWYGDTNTFRVFMHILLNANYRPTEYKGVTIGPGECVFGRKKWAKDLGLSERQVRTAIEHLKSTNEITMTSTNKFSVIHVTMWEFWQIGNGASTNEATNSSANERPSNDHQPTTSKEIKKYRNKDIVINKGPSQKEIKPNCIPGWTLEEKLAAWRGEE